MAENSCQVAQKQRFVFIDPDRCRGMAREYCYLTEQDSRFAYHRQYVISNVLKPGCILSLDVERITTEHYGCSLSVA